MTDDDQLRERLAAADPAADLAPVEPGRVDRLVEDAMTDHGTAEMLTRPASAPGPRRGRGAWLAAAAAVVLVAVGGVWLGLRGDDTPPTTSPAPDAGGSTSIDLVLPEAAPARCAMPSADVLQTADLALEATVTQVTPQRVSLEVAHWYTDTDPDIHFVEVRQGPAALRRLIGAADFRDGQRFLVATNADHQVMVCGYTAQYSDGLAALYAEAFGS